jgi:hypothetical protein
MRFASILLLALVALGFTTAVAPARSLSVAACGAADPNVRHLCYSWQPSPTAGVSYRVRTTLLNKIDWSGFVSDSSGAFSDGNTAQSAWNQSIAAPALGDSLIVRVRVWAEKDGLASDTIAAQFVVKRIQPAPAPPSGLVIDSLP